MKFIYTFIGIVLISVSLLKSQTVTNTYSAGDIPVADGAYDAACNGPGSTLEVVLPAGGPWQVNSIEIEYDMTAGNGAYMSEQISKVYCQNTTNEEGDNSGAGSSEGTYSYLRTGVNIANGVYAGGTNLIFEMHAYRTWSSASGCNTNDQKVDDNTWIITVLYSAAVDMSFVSSTTFQNNISDVAPSSTNQEIIGIEVVTSGAANPIDLSEIKIICSGTDNIADIENANLWYTGLNNTFSTTNPFGLTVAVPPASPTEMTFTGTQALEEGTNYFWLSYDIVAGATINNFIDAECTQLTVDGSNYIPSETNPVGARQIKLSYCTSNATNSSDSEIDEVVLAGNTVIINNNTAGTCAQYTDFTGLAPSDLAIGSSYQIDVTGGTCGGNYDKCVAVYIDWNQDGDFDDIEETIGTAGPNSVVTTYNFPFTVPAGAITGTTRMRVIVQETADPSNISSCGTYSYGETEDYSVLIEPASPMVYISCTASQLNTDIISAGSTNQELIRLEIVTNGALSPLDATQFRLRTDNSDDYSTDITDVKIWYTGNSNTFALSNQFGGAITALAPGTDMIFDGNQTLETGINYFWVTYNVPSTATDLNYVDAMFQSVVIDGNTELPIISEPVGRRQIVYGCEHTITLFDSDNNGWEGGLLIVQVNGTNVLTDITCTTNDDAFVFLAEDGDNITTIYTPGTNSEQNRYTITNPNGAYVGSDGHDLNAPSGITVVADCSSMPNFTHNGNSYQTDFDCIIITEDRQGQNGSSWYNYKIDLSNDFQIDFDVYLGNEDTNPQDGNEGADGLVFALQGGCAAAGGDGSSIGYGGINESIAIEFDSYVNGSNGDTDEDHIAIVSNGSVNHGDATNLDGPNIVPDFETDVWHTASIQWNATTQTLEVYFNSVLSASYTGDIVTDVFAGNPNVFWGFTAGTGLYYNRHEICLTNYPSNTTILNDVCCNPCNETVQVAPGGNSYTWTPNDGSISNPNIYNPVFTPTSTTEYTVLMEDGCGNFVTDVFTIYVADLIITPTGPFCEVDPSTNLIASEAGGTWSGTGIVNACLGTFDPAIAGLGDHTITYEISNPICTYSEDLIIHVDPSVTPTFAAVGPYCSGDAIPALPTTSTNGITGTWSPAIDNTATTDYTFTPAGGECATTQTLTITIDPLVTPMFAAVGPYCNGDAIPALPTTSTNGINGTWSPAIDNTATTLYTFTPTVGQCAASTSLTITVIPQTVPTFAAVGPYCNGDAIPALPTTSTNGINGTWSPAINNTATTEYTFTPTGGQCATTQTLTITIDPLITPMFAAVGPYCNGDVIPVLPTTSTNGINGTWSPAIDNTATTEYTFTPAGGQCATTQTLTITIDPLITPMFAAVGPYCNGDAIPALPTTSTNGIMGTWSPAIDNTTATEYTFTPTVGQCATTQTLTIDITQPTIPTFAAVGPYCNGDAIPALPTTSTNGVTGTWLPAIDNTSTTEYTFTPDGGECATTQTLTIDIIQPTIPTFDAVGPYCLGETIPALPTTSTNGITGTWSPVIDNTATTEYTFTPTGGQCATTTTLTITVIPPGTVPTFDAVGPYCSGDVVSALPTTSNNAIIGSWSPAINNISTTLYTFTPDDGQCAVPTTLTITIDNPIDPIFNVVGPYCNGESIPELPTTSINGINGTWSPAIDNTLTTEYTFTPAGGECANETTLTIDITQPTIPTFDAVGPYCNGESVPELPTTSTNGVNGTWSPAIDNTLTTEYTFTPAGGECANETALTIDIIQPAIPTFDAVGPYCNGDAIPALPSTSNNGVIGTWLPPIDNTSTTEYVFTPDGGECAEPTALTIEIDTPLDPTFDSFGPYCVGASNIILPSTSNNSISGTWDPAQISTATPGTSNYEFTPNSEECANSYNTDVVIDPSIDPLFKNFGPYCVGGIAEPLPLISDNSITGTWSPGSISTDTDGAFTYTFTADPGICATIYTTDVTVNPNIMPTFDDFGPYCIGDTPDSLPLVSNNNITGTWSAEEIDTETFGTETYTFTSEATQCFDLYSTDVIVYDYPNVSIYITDTVLLSGGEADIDVTGAENYTWIYGGLFPCDNCSMLVYQAPNEQSADETFEFILISESNNCSVTDTIRITVLGDIPLMIPEGFSPNGDGNADTWVIQGAERLTKSEVYITNRWGNKVYTASPYNNDWGGESLSGGKLAPGTYYYVFIPDKDGEESYAGYVYINY